MGLQPHSFFYILSEWQNRIVARETIWPRKSEIFTMWPFIESVCRPLVYKESWSGSCLILCSPLSYTLCSICTFWFSDLLSYSYQTHSSSHSDTLSYYFILCLAFITVWNHPFNVLVSLFIEEDVSSINLPGVFPLHPWALERICML